MVEDFVCGEGGEVGRRWGAEESEGCLQGEDSAAEEGEAGVEALTAVFEGFVG